MDVKELELPDNFTNWAEVEKSFQALGQPWQAFLMVIYSVTAIVSLCSNLLTIIILLRGEHLSTELWKFLLNLSVADILMAVFCIPFTYTSYTYGMWVFPHCLCPIINFVQVTSVTVSIWTLTAIGLDRYFAIIYPFRPLLWLKQHKFAFVAAIWGIGFLVASPLLVVNRVIPLVRTVPSNVVHYYDCKEQWGDEINKAYTIFLFLATFLVPICALIFVYSRICYHLWRNAVAPGNPDQQRDKVVIDRNMKVIKMLCAICILFGLCWFPLHCFQLLYMFFPGFQQTAGPAYNGYFYFVGAYFLCHWMAMAHSMVNPLVYCFKSNNFRKSLTCTLGKCFTRFTGFEGDDCRDLTMTQVQSVSMMHTNGNSLHLTPQGDTNNGRILRDTVAVKNGHSSNHNIKSATQIDDDEFV